MKNMRVSLKLIVSFMIVLALAIAVGLVGIFGMYSINSADDALYRENVVAISAIGAIREMYQDQRVQLRNMAIWAGDSAKVQEYSDSLATLDKNIRERFVVYDGTIVDESAETAYYEARNLYENDYQGIKDQVAEAAAISAERARTVLFSQDSVRIVDGIMLALDNATVDNDTWAKDTVDDNTVLFTRMLIIEIVILAVAAGVALFFAFYISGLIAKPLNDLSGFMKKAGGSGDISLSQENVAAIGKYSHVKDEIGQAIAGSASFISHVTNIAKGLESIAQGDLTQDVKLLSDSDTMGLSLKKMTENLNNMFTDIRSATEQVSTGAGQVAGGAQSLAQGSTEQAASIEELSGSIAEIAEKTKTNAATANKTASLSAAIKDNAEKGSRQMGEMIAAVGEINEASKNIGKIIKTIDDIAFQTNILALNAAVEAARAGQHGKGFAVVADEVRNLASKSANAAKDTGDMIQNSMEKAEFGSRIAAETSASLSGIVTGINESSQLIAEIAKASEEQSFGISQINIGIDQVAQVVQQNSATAEESAAASEEMSGQSEMLQQLIGRFRIRDGESMQRSLPSPGGPVQRLGHGGFALADGGDFGKY
ncbi:MAG: methyl-accepting chemotaxis protein [Clostridiales Family XIII bacterium]|jgi:methyl-accepting chemotaxis protein|nr:methyl-accepting chemotaxis protein [Clostridiales Family XIII bacterium]